MNIVGEQYIFYFIFPHYCFRFLVVEFRLELDFNASFCTSLGGGLMFIGVIDF